MRRKFANPSEYKRWRRHQRVRNRVVGTPERPRVCVFRSNDHIYAQLIDDTAGRTLLAVSSLKLDAAPGAKPAAKAENAKPENAKPENAKPESAKPESAKPESAKPEGKKGKKGEKAEKEAAGGRKTTLAREVGRLLAEAAKAKGVGKVCFDRGGYLYHGRVAALADSARKHGLDF
jgi:large subunit ribosomal protein L18